MSVVRSWEVSASRRFSEMYSMIKSIGGKWCVRPYTRRRQTYNFHPEVWSGKLRVPGRTRCYSWSPGMSPWNADLQGSRNQCTNNKINKSYEHGSTPSFVLSSYHEAFVKLLAGRRLGCDWALLRFAPREVCRLIKLCRTCHCDYCSWVDGMSHERAVLNSSRFCTDVNWNPQ